MEQKVTYRIRIKQMATDQKTGYKDEANGNRSIDKL